MSQAAEEMYKIVARHNTRLAAKMAAIANLERLAREGDTDARETLEDLTISPNLPEQAIVAVVDAIARLSKG